MNKYESKTITCFDKISLKMTTDVLVSRGWKPVGHIIATGNVYKQKLTREVKGEA